jgi:hypothetical protein
VPVCEPIPLTATAARLLQERLGLSDDELLDVLAVDPLTLLAGDDLAHRPELALLLALTEEHDAALLRRWLRVGGRHGRPLDLLTERDFGGFEHALADLGERGFRIGGRSVD